MDNNKKIPVICQCLCVLNLSGYRSLLGDHRSRKLSAGMSIELHVLAQLLQLKSYDLITEHLRAHPKLQQAIGLESISPSQLSRKTKTLCTGSLQELFCHLVEQIRHVTKSREGMSKDIGRLHLLDATDIRLPEVLGHWARCGSKKTGVRLHVRLVVADPDTVFPDQIIASTVNVREAVVAMELTTDKDVTYVMDRGYEKCAFFQKWTLEEKRFVVRVRDRLTLHPIPGTEREIPQEHGHVLQDVNVLTNKTTVPIRLVAFQDEKGQRYRVVTSRWDLSAAEIAQIYKNRWLIELFFKWVKQHLNMIQLHSFDPNAVWNQLFLSLIAFAVSLLVKLSLQMKKTLWMMVKMLRTYPYDSWETFIEALNRPPTRKSKGRQKKADHQLVLLTPQRIILR
jgi:FOG: Transposase and inactivated derivatives